MKGKDLFHVIGQLKDQYLQEAEDFRKPKRRNVRRGTVLAAVAACFAVVFLLAIGSMDSEETGTAGGAERFLAEIDGKQIAYYYAGEIPYDETLLGEKVDAGINTNKIQVYQFAGKADYAELLRDQIDNGKHILARFTYGGIVRPTEYTLQEDMYYFGLTSADDIQSIETSLWDGYGELSPEDFPICDYIDRQTIEEFYDILTEGRWLNADEYALEQYKAVDYTMWSITMCLKNGSSYQYYFYPDSYNIDFYYGDYHILLTTEQKEWMENACGITDEVKRACKEIYD
ncbi:MAG: hypothetical protein LUE11_02065 [Clostridia bacterium]|nr:hypothetical protein [Clostridia bacterium]